MLPLLGGACGLFSSKKPVLPTKPPGSSWALVEGTHDGSLLLARVRTQLGEIVRHSAYPFRVGVATPLRQLAGNGIPTPEENATLLEVEDRLAEILEADRAAVHVITLTTNGVKEWVFYASDPKTMKQRMGTLAPTVNTHRLQMVVERDADWEVYHQFLKAQ